jgi:MFS family permease
MFHAPHFNWYGRGFKLRAAITIACQLAFVLFGYDQGVFSGIVGNENFLNTFDHPSPGLEGIIVSIYNLGCFTGCILSFMFCEKTGRRLAMWIAMVWIIVGTKWGGVGCKADDDGRSVAHCKRARIQCRI